MNIWIGSHLTVQVYRPNKLDTVVQLKTKCPPRHHRGASFSFSPWDGTSLQRRRGWLAVSGAAPADCCSLRGAPDPSLLVWPPRLLSTGDGRVGCWSAGSPTCLQTHECKQKSHTYIHTHTHTYIHRYTRTQEPVCWYTHAVKQTKTSWWTTHDMRTSFTCDRDYAILSVHQQSSCLCDSVCVEILEAEVVGI